MKSEPGDERSLQSLGISAHLAEKIREHGVETYPYECCGALMGRDSEMEKDLLPRSDADAFGVRNSRQVLKLFPLVNRRDESPRNRFSW